jgi:hypothetical protein
MDFGSLVVGPCQDAFSKPIIVTPLKSMPYRPAYAARGIWTVRHVDIALEDGGIMTSRTISIDVNLSELPVPILQGDQIAIIADDQFVVLATNAAPGSVVNLLVDDVRDDSGGASKLIMKRVM